MGNNKELFSRRCYYVCLGFFAVLSILFIILNVTDIRLAEDLALNCLLHEISGYYCPGCGGTRAVDALAHGKLMQSLFYHPVVPYAAALLVVYIISHIIGILSKERVKSMQFRPIYFYIMIGIVLIQCIVKNAVLFFWGVSLL